MVKKMNGIGGSNSSRVDHTAVAPDLALRPGEHLNIPHLKHGLDELGLPCRLAAHEGLDQRLHRRVGQKCSVRLEEPQVVDEADVVLVVELCGRDEVHERRRRREELAAVGRADALEQERVRLAQCRINLYYACMYTNQPEQRCVIISG